MYLFLSVFLFVWIRHSKTKHILLMKIVLDSAECNVRCGISVFYVLFSWIFSFYLYLLFDMLVQPWFFFYHKKNEGIWNGGKNAF